MDYGEYKKLMARRGETIEQRLKKNSDKMNRDRKRLKKFRGGQRRWKDERKKQIQEDRRLWRVKN